MSAIDVTALAARFDSLDPSNRTVWSLWTEAGHGLGLAQRATDDAQQILARAIVPTNEFPQHDAVLAFAKRAEALSDRVQKQPYDDSASPLWSDIKAYFLDGSRLVNNLEAILDGSLKWSDVGDAAKGAAKTFELTSALLIGGAVLLGAGVLYAGYRVLASPTGKTVTRAAVGRYLPRRVRS